MTATLTLSFSCCEDFTRDENDPTCYVGRTDREWDEDGYIQIPIPMTTCPICQDEIEGEVA